MDNAFERQKSLRWVYLILGVVILLCLGLIYAWSVFRTPLEIEFGWTKTQTSITFSISMIMFCLGGLASGIVTDMKGPRFTLIACAAFLAAGFLIASGIQSLIGLYVTYGGLAGFGVGLGYNSCISTCVKWFPDKQGLISGLVMFGFGCGAMILGTLAAWLIVSQGWRATFLIIGISFAIIIFIGAMIIRPVSREFLKQFTTTSKKITRSLEDINWKEMFHRRNWWLYLVWASILTGAGLAIFNVSAVYAASFLENDLTRAAAIAGIVSIANGAGRIIFGQIFDMRGYKFTMIGVCVAFALSALILMDADISQSLGILVAGFLLIGFGYGGIATCNSAFTVHFFGTTHYSLNFSLATCNVIFASIIGPLCDMGTYMTAFISILGLSIIAFILTMLIRVPKKQEEA